MSTKAIERFLRPPSDGGAYDDQRLAALLAHTEDGKLAYLSCCCLMGFPSATHAYQGNFDLPYVQHPDWSTHQDYSPSAEFNRLGHDDAERRARLIPLILAEIARRDALKTQQASAGRGDYGVAQEGCFCPALTE